MIKQLKTILIVEDEQDIRKAIADRFAYEGFWVFEAEDGVQGLKVALKERPDLILLDIMMPKMDGMVMLKKLRANKLGKDVPVVILTNLDKIEEMAEALEGEVYDYLLKSDWNLEDIVKRVKDKLKL